MSIDADIDSRMASSTEDLEDDDDNSDNNEDLTALHSQTASGLPSSSSFVVSPPQSQSRDDPASTSTPTMPATVSDTALANSNGKRPLNTISNGLEDASQQQQQQQQQQSNSTMIVKGKQRQQVSQQQQQLPLPLQTHAASGYTWTQPEDGPGHAWTTKKALDEHDKAVEGMVHREVMVKGRYGDIFDMVERERAKVNSLKQR